MLSQLNRHPSDMITLRMNRKWVVIAALAASVAVPGIANKASCADCSLDNLAGTRRAFESFDQNCTKQIAASAAAASSCFDPRIYYTVLPVMTALAKDHRFGPAERVLTIASRQNHEVPYGATRILQTIAPVDRDTLTIEIDKGSGSSGAIVRICAVDRAGAVKRAGTIRFEDTAAPETRSAIVNGVQGKMVRVDIASFGESRTKFQYTLKAS